MQTQETWGNGLVSYRAKGTRTSNQTSNKTTGPDSYSLVQTGQLGRLFTGRQEKGSHQTPDEWMHGKSEVLREYNIEPSNVKARLLLGTDLLSFRRRRKRG